MSHNQHTEDEARTKECRVAAIMPAVSWVGFQGTLSTPTRPTCIASRCMHWRGGGRAPRIVERAASAPMLDPPFENSLHPGWVRNGDEYVRHEWADVGYCGLAGEP